MIMGAYYLLTDSHGRAFRDYCRDNRVMRRCLGKMFFIPAVVSWQVREGADGVDSDYLGERSKVVHCRNCAAVGEKRVLYTIIRLC